MEILDLIAIVSPKEERDFIRFLTNRSKNGHNNSVVLFKALLNGQADLKKKEWGANRYNVIKKRLGDNLSSFIAEQIVENEAQIEVELIKKLLLARKLLRFKKYKTAFTILSKAKEKAKQAQLYSILNEIHHSMLECSLEKTSIIQEPIVIEFQDSLKQYAEQEQRTIANTRLKKAFRDAEYEGKEVAVFHEFEQYKQDLVPSATQKFDFNDLLDMATIADAQASYYKNYAEINVFFIDRLREIEQLGETKTSQLPAHIKLIYLIANIYFRKKEFKKSLVFLAEMKILMEKENALFRKRFEVSYLSLMALNFNFLGFHKRASLLLDQHLVSKDFLVQESLNPLLIRSMIAFQQGEYKLTSKLFANFQNSDRYYEKRMGRDWLLNKKYIEILLHIELQNDDFVDSRINSLVKKHGAYLKSKSSFQVLPFLKLVKLVYREPNTVNKEEFEAKVDAILIRKPSDQEDLFLICFYAWLKSKMTGKPIYETTLGLLSN
ncbi:MAG: hypothetical protein ACJASF_002413 [Vicingaceae bacterium]